MKNAKILLALLLIFTLFLFSGCGRGDNVNQGMPDTNNGITNDGITDNNNNGTDNGTRDGNDNGMGTDRNILDDNLTDGGIKDNTNQ